MTSYVQDVIDRLDKKIPGNTPAVLRAYALLVLTTGEDTTHSDVHQAWGIARVEEGWGFAEVKDKDAKLTPYLVPFPDLTPEIVAYDDEYVAAIQEVARDLRVEGVAH